ncbi:hypothetical protein OC846_002553 [Tilletia horrida]|uniref:Eukaryotic translation initiation factor 3 subunit L n=1 Tax=Tilletia horrida TaxID=155126 RepID=A0AAN6GRQ9_9BASI|nr:hypothetical protein OC846_002553 [Tilletia horrida]KAK0567695.1 hypothetical protein OC861_002549 [Tilletia horrida]
MEMDLAAQQAFLAQQQAILAAQAELLRQQHAAYYAQDADEDDDFLADGEVDMAVGDFSQQQAGFLDENNNALAEAQLQAQFQQAAAALAAVPEQVRKYIVLFHQALQNNSLPEISNAYEANWNRLTEKFYARAEWPDAEVIAPLVNEDPKFLMLYRELWYRHVYSRLSPDGEDRFHSYDNYCDFFNFVLNSDGPVALELPAQWLWDIIDEFIYQFQSYSQWRNRVSTKTEDELVLLQDGGVWSAYSVLNVLYSLIQKSRITEQLLASLKGEDVEEAAGDFGARPLYKLLGYFSTIGLLRVHVLLGDYTLALKTLDFVELNKKSGLMNRVTACHVTAYYYVGFAYMMLRRYPDAIRAFTHILVFIQRLRQYHTRSYQYDQINKTADRMYALLAMCCALCPTRLDENIQSVMRDKYGEQFSKMSRGDDGALQAFEELFLYACPKFITSTGPPYHDPEALPNYKDTPAQDPAQHQLKLFLTDVRSQLTNSNIRSFLRLYTSLGTDKLSKFLSVEEEELVEMMMVMKRSTRSIKWTDGGLLEGDVINTSDLDFVIDTNMVHIAESRIGRRYGDWFLRNGTRMRDVLDNVRSKALPIVDAAKLAAQSQQHQQQQQQSQQGGAGARTGGGGGGGGGAPRSGGAAGGQARGGGARQGAWGAKAPAPTAQEA